ncbi:MAG: helix-turn-helix domain-containing protein [Vicinamibacterales bacterium]
MVVALDGAVAICGADAIWQECAAAIVRPDVEHAFDCNGAHGVMLFVDPESSEGAWLCGSLSRDVTALSAARADAVARELRILVEQPDEVTDVDALVRRAVQALRPGKAPARRLDPRVTAVLDAIRQSDDLRLSLADAAGTACLSPSRFAHLFKEQVGLPFSRYLLWRKLTRAMVAVGSERTLAAAAHAADFADAAHLTRTFYQMVGMAPSVLMRGDFTEIASPFAIATEAPAVRRFPRPVE